MTGYFDVACSPKVSPMVGCLAYRWASFHLILLVSKLLFTSIISPFPLYIIYDFGAPNGWLFGIPLSFPPSESPGSSTGCYTTGLPFYTTLSLPSLTPCHFIDHDWHWYRHGCLARHWVPSLTFEVLSDIPSGFTTFPLRNHLYLASNAVREICWE